MSRNLDMLRAVAVLAVFFAHLLRDVLGIDSPGIRDAGRAGVFLFFVHTSLVLLLSFERSPRWTVPSFYVRRAFRIYPLSIACVLLVYALHVPFEPLHRFASISLPRLLANLALVQNLSPSWKEVIAPLWSLSWEMQMYLVLPFLYLALRRHLRTPHLLALWALTGIAGGITWGEGPLRALRILQYVPCFLGGAIAFVHLTRSRTRRQLPSFIWPLVAVGSVLVYPLLQPLSFAGKYVLCLLLGIAIPYVAELPESLATRASHLIAKYSYGIYLAHFPVMWFVFQKSGLAPALQWPLFIALMIAVPVAAYHLIEQPLIDAGRKLAERLERPHVNCTVPSPDEGGTRDAPPIRS